MPPEPETVVKIGPQVLQNLKLTLNLAPRSSRMRNCRQNQFPGAPEFETVAKSGSPELQNVKQSKWVGSGVVAGLELGSLLSPCEPWVTELEPAGYGRGLEPDHSSRVPSSVSHAWRDSGPDAKLPDQ